MQKRNFIGVLIVAILCLTVFPAFQEDIEVQEVITPEIQEAITQKLDDFRKQKEAECRKNALEIAKIEVKSELQRRAYEEIKEQKMPSTPRPVRPTKPEKPVLNIPDSLLNLSRD